MAKANKRARKGLKSHGLSGEYKIPVHDRKAFMGNNKDKWVNKDKYNKYIQWKKNQM